MPHTMNKVNEIIHRLDKRLKTNLILLVVPGCRWSDNEIAKLKQYQDEGIYLAGHGWHHRAIKVNSFYHRLHSLLISRKAAEHLSLPSIEIFQLIENCYQWFIDKGFKSPELYVPPAWAMGRITLQHLSRSSFRYFENTTGLIDSSGEEKKCCPWLGLKLIQI